MCALQVSVARAHRGGGALLPDTWLEEQMGMAGKLAKGATSSMQRDLVGGRVSELHEQVHAYTCASSCAWHVHCMYTPPAASPSGTSRRAPRVHSHLATHTHALTPRDACVHS